MAEAEPLVAEAFGVEQLLLTESSMSRMNDSSLDSSNWASSY